MPKRKATTQLSGLVGSDDEDVIQMNGADHSPEPEERAVKRARGRPAKAATTAAPKDTRSRVPAAASAVQEEPAKKKRGRPKGSGTRAATEEPEQEEPVKETKQRRAKAQSREPEPEPEPEVSSEDEMEQQQQQPAKKTAAASKTAPPRGGRKKASTEELEENGDDGQQDESDFEYTPRSQKVKSRSDSKIPETQQPDPNTVEESFLPDLPAAAAAAPRRSGSLSPSKADPRKRPSLGFSPAKRKAGESSEPELRRKVGELTRKCETLEHRYRSLKEIGVTEATSNVAKLTKQCDTITAASDNLVNSLKEELAAQKALGQQTRLLQKQLSARDSEVAELRSQAEGAAGQLASAQTEVKALQSKLTAARNTAASLESAAAKVPGSAVKGGANRTNVAVAANTEVAQLKEDLYSDLTGLIIRDVKKGDTETLYDCIQTGVNGTLHFKLSVPHVSAADFESAEFQYVPLLDEDRDRDLVAMLPEYLTVEITFSRQQASKFYTRVIDILTKRRSSNGSSG